MPTFNILCADCKKWFDHHHNLNDPDLVLVTCPACNKPKIAMVIEGKLQLASTFRFTDQLVFGGKNS